MIDHDFEHDPKLRSTVRPGSRFDSVFFSGINFYSVSVSFVDAGIDFFIKSILRPDIHIKLFLFELRT